MRDPAVIRQLHPDDGEQQTAAAISFIHAMTKHLLHVPNDQASEIFIGVLPRDDVWHVRVSYSGFFLEMEATTLSEALGQVVGSLTARVSNQLEEGAKLLGKT